MSSKHLWEEEEGVIEECFVTCGVVVVWIAEVSSDGRVVGYLTQLYRV